MAEAVMAEAVIQERQLLKALRWYDGFVVALANPGFLIGSLGYFTAGLGALASYRPRRVRVQVDGETIIGPHLLVVAANGEHFANGMRIAPGAKVDDGMLDLCVIGDTSLPESVGLLARVYRGTHVRHPKVRLVRVHELVVEQEGALPVQFDGEPSQAERLEVRCVPGGLAVVTPQDS